MMKKKTGMVTKKKKTRMMTKKKNNGMMVKMKKNKKKTLTRTRTRTTEESLGRDTMPEKYYSKDSTIILALPMGGRRRANRLN